MKSWQNPLVGKRKSSCLYFDLWVACSTQSTDVSTVGSIKPDTSCYDASAEVLLSHSHADVWSGFVYTSLMQSLCIHMLMPAICPHFRADV